MDKISCGGFLLGNGLSETFNDDGQPVLNAEQSELTPATADTLGGVKIGEGINVEEDGTISVSGGGENFIVTLTEGTDEWTCDKTWGEIKSEILAGTNIEFKLIETTNGYIWHIKDYMVDHDWEDSEPQWDMPIGVALHFITYQSILEGELREIWVIDMYIDVDGIYCHKGKSNWARRASDTEVG